MTKRIVTVSQFETEIKKYIREKKRQQPSSSVRDQAAQWKISQSTLQKVVKGERKLGYHAAKEIAQYFNVEVTRSKEPRIPRPTGWKLRPLDPRSESHLGWVNLAILEMIKLKDFSPNVEWVADRLGLFPETVETLVTKMEDSKMLKRTPGAWHDLMGDAGYNNPSSTTAELRAGIKQIMELSIHKIDEVPYEFREHGIEFMPISSRQLSKLKKKITAMRVEFGQAAQNTRFPKDQIYSFHVGFFPVTKTL